ncbi:hypothetical protein AAE478_000827 [Parahypoxylon ruwenzoriense]
MAKPSRSWSAVGSGDRSPPPAYSRRPPPVFQQHPTEQTPLFGYIVESIPDSGRPTGRAFQGLDVLRAALFSISSISFLLVLYMILTGTLSFNIPATLPPPLPTYSVAIIGAGPAGISAAQHLLRSTATRDIRFNITIFESSPLIGGQLALNDSTGGPVFPYNDPRQDPITAEDVAGTALVWGSPLFTKASEESLGDKVGFSDGIISQTTRPYDKTPTMAWLGLIWRYGSSIWHAGAMTKEGGLHDRVANAPLVSDMMQLMISMGIVDSVQQSARDALDARGIGGAYVTEVLGPQVERACSQKISDISALAMMLAAAQEDTANSYIGGELIDRLEQILGVLRVTVRTATEVSGLKHSQINDLESAWLVKYSSTPGSPGSLVEAFDKVIIAAPSFDLYHAASPENIEAASVLTYRSVDVTFFTVPTRLNPELYGNVDQILFPEEQNSSEGDGLAVRELAFVREIARVRDDGTRNVEYLYRALSNGDATERLRKLDLGITWLYRARLDNAHPDSYPLKRFPPFMLSDKGLWWASAIHTIASTVDLSWLAGRIVAQEIINDVTK